MGPGHCGRRGGRCRGTWAAVAGYDRVRVIIIVIISEDVKRVIVTGLLLMNPWQSPVTVGDVMLLEVVATLRGGAPTLGGAATPTLGGGVLVVGELEGPAMIAVVGGWHPSVSACLWQWLGQFASVG